MINSHQTQPLLRLENIEKVTAPIVFSIKYLFAYIPGKLLL